MISPLMSRFMPAELPEGGMGPLPISRSLFTHGMTRELESRMDALQRGDFGGQDPQQALMSLQLDLMNSINRAQTLSGTPVREDLEAETKKLVPIDTPFRNRLPRTVGSGSASVWKQQTSVGGGYGVTTTVTTGASSATQTVGSTAGMIPGMSLYFATTNAYRIISSVTNATTVVLTATISTTTAEAVSAGPYAQRGAANVQAFFAESGAPGNASPTYATKTATYKLLGTMFSITNLAMAAGASFENALAAEKTAAIRRLMLMEENALINSVSTNVYAPYGDGTTAYGFDGLIASLTTANGVPIPQVQTSVGALTTAHMDQQLARTNNEGAMDPWIMCNAQEALSLVHLAEASGSIIRVQATAEANTILGVSVVGYKHPVTGQIVPILVSRFMPAGTMVFGADYLPDGTPAMDVRVLPQVQLPELAPNVSIQGYTAQEVAPTTSAPHVFPGIVSVYEVPRFKGVTVCAVSSGLTAV